MSPVEMNGHSQNSLEDDDVDLEDSTSSPEADASHSHEAGAPNDAAPRAKRIACVICRKRKLRCDGQKPACGTCSRLGHRCGYDEVRRKSGPKRGYVKELEARLKNIESQLKSKQTSTPPVPPVPAGAGVGNVIGMGLDGDLSLGGQDMLNGFAAATSMSGLSSGVGAPDLSAANGLNGGEFPWEMIGLGLEEPLPPQEMIDELHQVYFDKLHYTMPMIHKYRYLAAMNLAPHMRPSICLRYAIWAMSCSVIEKYFGYAETFYQRARKYAERDEMKGCGESMVTVGHCQAWVLISLFEFKNLFFPRAWMSAGRCVRLGTMLSLHRQDGPGLEVKQTLPPPRDWTDREERRRTFWMTYNVDKYASIGTGWPMSIEEADISTNLPASNEDYEKSRAVQTPTLAEALTPDGASKISSFGGVCVIACIFGKNLNHLHRSTEEDAPDDLAGPFWKRHHKLDGILMTTSMYLPDHLRVPAGIRDPNAVAVNMYLHSATICLHQAAILKAEKHNLGTSTVRESTARCFLAASELVSLMKLVTPLEIAYMNPFTSFCLYVAARIFMHSYRKHPNNESIRNNLYFLFSAMQAHRSKNNLTESFLTQLQVELDAAGLDHPLHNRSNYRGNKTPQELYQEGSHCPPVFPRQSDTQPTFQELQSSSASPPVVRADGNSPLPFSGGPFTVPTREQRSGSTHLSPSAYTPSGSGDAPVLTPTHGSSTQSFSPHPQDDVNGLANGGQTNFYGTQNQRDFFADPATFGDVSAAGDVTLDLPADWATLNGLGDGAWTMDGMNWDNGPVMHHGM